MFAAFAVGAPALGGLAVALPMWVAILVGRVSGAPDGDALYVLGFPLPFGLFGVMFGLVPAALTGLDAALLDRRGRVVTYGRVSLSIFIGLVLYGIAFSIGAWILGEPTGSGVFVVGCLAPVAIPSVLAVRLQLGRAGVLPWADSEARREEGSG